MGAWGYGLFQSDHDFEMLTDLGDELGLTQVEESAKASAKDAGQEEEDIDRIYYTIYGPNCSDPELVRKYLDSDVLAKMTAEKEAKLLAIPSYIGGVFGCFASDSCYVYILLGACAMTLGCQLPDAYIYMLRKVYTEGGLMTDALKQMKKALFGPHAYKNGVPYDFESKDLLETANAQSTEDRAPNSLGYQVMNVRSPGRFFGTGMGNSGTSVVIKELREKHNYPDVCGGCRAKSGEGGKALLMCSRCRDRRYCSTECQAKHWKVHKKLCEPATVS